MAKVTSKLQMTIPKSVADRLGIRPGDELDVVVEGDSLRVSRDRARPRLTADERLAIFEAAMARQDRRIRASGKRRPPHGNDRGWSREDLYTNDRAR